MSGGPDIQSPASAGDPLAPPGAPNLPPGAAEPTPMRERPPEPSRHNGRRVSAYRSDHQRARSVYRRANPWYRRLARSVVGICFLVVGAAALYFGARELQDYLDRDRLPAAGVDIPAFQTTTFQITSAAPAPVLDGTLEIDVQTRAFRFVGRDAGAQVGVQVVSLDGSRMLVQTDDGWTEAGGDNEVAIALSQAIPFLIGSDSGDDILINRMRNGYVELVDKTTEGVGDTARDRYEMRFDFASYAADQPLEWEAFQQEIVPGVAEINDSSLTIWLDSDHVLVRMRDPQANWNWERLAYIDQPLDADPTGEIAAAAGI